MTIRFATEKDVPRLGDLLCQVDLVHHRGRPDIFKVGRKYSDEELTALLGEDTRPILVAVDDADTVQGYCFCILQQHVDDGVLTDIKTLYIDDLCVDETCRGQHVGTVLYEAVLALARERGCYNVTLHVWNCNAPAMKFYEHLGMQCRQMEMETLL